MERVMGIEPTYAVWKTAVLPLNYTRVETRWGQTTDRGKHSVRVALVNPRLARRFYGFTILRLLILVLVEKIESVPPPSWGLLADIVVVAALHELKLFRTGVTFKQSLARFRAEDFVVAGDN